MAAACSVSARANEPPPSSGGGVAAILSEQLLGLQDEFDMGSFPGRLEFFVRIANPMHMLTTAAEITAAKHTLLEHHRISELRARSTEAEVQQKLRVQQQSTSSWGWEWGWHSLSYCIGLCGAADAARDINADVLGRSYLEARESMPSPEEASAARWTLAGTVHPKSAEPILLPFRMAAWPFFGGVPCAGLMYLAKFNPGNLVASGAGQWINQSHNALTNFCNGAADNGGDQTAVFAKGYVGAVSAAMALALGAGVLVQQRFMLPFKYLLPFVPFPAVAGANVLNTYLLRKHEIESGIDVCDEDGTIVGQSVVAAKEAIFQTCVTRVAIPAGNFVLAPLFLLPLAKPLAATKWLRLPVCFGVTVVVFGAWLPISLAIYPQCCKLDVAKLEPELAAKAKGSVVVYNKGL